MRPTIELSMIVKDGAATLARCLRSVRGVVDRIVVGDTGSTDDSVRIARSFGAEVVPVVWTEDFAAARNAVLRHAICDWVLVLDGDELLDQDGRRALRQLALHTGPAAYDVWRLNYVCHTNTRNGEEGALPNPRTLPEADSFPAFVKSRNTRLFRRDPRVYFERPVHETVTGRLSALGLATAVAPFVLHHLGHAEDESTARRRKNLAYQQIGRQHLRDHPDDSQTCYELAMGELELFHNPEAALALCLRALALDPLHAHAMILGGICLVRLQRHDAAAQLLAHAVPLQPGSIVLHETLGDSFFHRQRYADAGTAYGVALSLGSASALVLAKHGICCIYGGETAQGVRALRRAFVLEPDFAELRDVILAGALLARDDAFVTEVRQTPAGFRVPSTAFAALHG